MKGSRNTALDGLIRALSTQAEIMEESKDPITVAAGGGTDAAAREDLERYLKDLRCGRDALLDARRAGREPDPAALRAAETIAPKALFDLLNTSQQRLSDMRRDRQKAIFQAAQFFEGGTKK